MDNETLEGNKLIAEFMGHGGGISDEWNNKPADYNASWLWLMPVVEKICNIGSFDINIHSWTCEFTDESKVPAKLICRAMYPDKIKPMLNIIYETVVEFIKWYNQNK